MATNQEGYKGALANTLTQGKTHACVINTFDRILPSAYNNRRGLQNKVLSHTSTHTRCTGRLCLYMLRGTRMIFIRDSINT